MAICVKVVSACAILCLVGARAGSPSSAPAKSGSAPPAGLRLTIDRVSRESAEVSFENADKNPIVLNLGVMLGNGRTLIPEQIHFVVADASGKSRELRWKGYGVAGRLDDFLVPLMPTAKYSMTLSLRDYVEVDDRKSASLAPGDTIHAAFEGVAPSHINEGAIPDLPIWKGKIMSDSTSLAD